jgi:hypothetical protein
MTYLAQKPTEAIAIDPRSELMILARDIIPKIKHLNAQIEAILEPYGHDDDAIINYLDGFTIDGKKDPYLESWAKTLQGLFEDEQCDPDCPLCAAEGTRSDRELDAPKTNPRDDLLAYFRVHHPILKELAAKVQAEEQIAQANRPDDLACDDDWKMIEQIIDKYWEGVSDEERTEIWNFMN